MNNKKDELDRKDRVINMMITMHSILYQQFKLKSQVGSIFFFITAIVLNVFTFFDYKYLSFTGISTSNIKNIIAFTSFLIFILSVIFMLVEWAKKSEQHLQAVNQLSRLLNELRSIQHNSDQTIVVQKTDLFNELYNQIFETIPKIPDNKFNLLKAKHYHKVELSKFIDKHKGKSYFVIRILYFINKLKSGEN